MKKLQKRNKSENTVKMFKQIWCPCICLGGPIYNKANDSAYTKKANNK